MNILYKKLDSTDILQWINLLLIPICIQDDTVIYLSHGGAPWRGRYKLVDGASSHRSKELKVLENVCLIRLPPYSPELNPAEQIWNVLCRDYFENRVFDSLNAATEQAKLGLAEMPANKISGVTPCVISNRE